MEAAASAGEFAFQYPQPCLSISTATTKKLLNETIARNLFQNKYNSSSSKQFSETQHFHHKNVL